MKDIIEEIIELVHVCEPRKRGSDASATAMNKAEFRSGTGNVHWVASQYCFNVTVVASFLQKAQCDVHVNDLLQLNACIADLKNTVGIELTIKHMKEPCILVGCTDSALQNTTCELVEGDISLKEFDQHQVRSQSGGLIGISSFEEFKSSCGDVSVPFLDWRTRASSRVTISTSAAETSAALDTYGMLKYVTALFEGTMIADFDLMKIGRLVERARHRLQEPLRPPQDRGTSAGVPAHRHLRCRSSASSTRRPDDLRAATKTRHGEVGPIAMATCGRPHQAWP